MAKKYYWLKLKDDFFQQKEIKKLRKIAGGDTYTIIYLKMQLLSIKNEGKLYFEEIEDDFAAELALEMDEDIENVRITILFLEKHGLLEYSEINEYTLLAAIASIGNETESAERVRRHRGKQKALQCNANVTTSNPLVTKSNTEKEKEKETETETDIENDVVEIFNQYNLDIRSVIKQKPNMFGTYHISEIQKVAKYLAESQKNGKIRNPVGYLISDPENIINMILSGQKQKRNPEYDDIYVPPEVLEELRAQQSKP